MRTQLIRTPVHELERLGGVAPPPAVAAAVSSALARSADEVETVTLVGPVVPDSWSTGVHRMAESLVGGHAHPDTVHALDVVAAAAALAARRRTGARVVVRAQLTPAPASGPMRVLWPLVLRAADAVHAPTAADVRAAVALGAPAERVVRCVDGALVAAGECAETDDTVDEMRSENYVLALSGVPDDERLQQELVRAVVAGDNSLLVASPSERDLPARAALRRLAAGAGVEDRVRLVGRLEPSGLIDLVDRSLVVVATRTQASCALAPLVAMHRARPVVAVAGSAADDVVVDGVTGRLVDLSSRWSFAGAVHDLSTARFRRLAWGVAGRDRVSSCFAPEQVARELTRAHEIAVA